MYREATGAGLAEAKEAVEKMTAEAQPAGTVPANTQARGCFGIFVAGAVFGGSLIWWAALA